MHTRTLLTFAHIHTHTETEIKWNERHSAKQVTMPNEFLIYSNGAQCASTELSNADYLPSHRMKNRFVPLSVYLVWTFSFLSCFLFRFIFIRSFKMMPLIRLFVKHPRPRCCCGSSNLLWNVLGKSIEIECHTDATCVYAHRTAHKMCERSMHKHID